MNPSNPSDETHVGIYFDGHQYHAKGRAYGVVCEEFKASYWQKYGWFRALKPDPAPDPCPDPGPDPEEKVLVVGGSVRVRDQDSTKGRHLFTAHKGDTFPLIEVAPSGWYRIKTEYPESYITNKARYTKLWTE